MKRLYVSAFQSAMFNEILARRIDAIDRVWVGDLAQKTDSGGIFVVEDEAAEQARAAAGEISPTGPIPGYRTQLAEGPGGQIESDVLEARRIDLEQFRRIGALKAKGTRRALRFALRDPDLESGSDEHGEYLALRFAAPSGCYATIAVEEITKSQSE